MSSNSSQATSMYFTLGRHTVVTANSKTLRMSGYTDGTKLGNTIKDRCDEHGVLHALKMAGVHWQCIKLTIKTDVILCQTFTVNKRNSTEFQNISICSLTSFLQYTIHNNYLEALQNNPPTTVCTCTYRSLWTHEDPG